MTAPEPTPTADEHADAACEVMHDAYERAAVGAGWETNPASRKPWADVPEANKATMRAAVGALLTSPELLDALVRAGVLPDTEALRHHLAIAEADASHLAATIRDARESLARNRGRGAGWEKVSQALRPMGLSDALARAERRGRVRAVSAQPNPRFGEVAP